MELRKSFETSYAPDAVWRGLSDVRLVASCLPGASIVEERSPDEYKGKLAIKVGPLAASFDGLISIERQPDERIAIVTGKGADAKSSSRVTAKMRYQVQPSAHGGGSQVDIHSDISLAGALAQFGKAAVMQEIASRMTNEFVKRFEAQLAHAHAAAERAPGAAPPADAGSASVGVEAHGNGSDASPGDRQVAATMRAAAVSAAAESARPPPPAPVEALDAGNLLWSILKDKVLGFFRRLFR